MLFSTDSSEVVEDVPSSTVSSEVSFELSSDGIRIICNRQRTKISGQDISDHVNSI